MTLKLKKNGLRLKLSLEHHMTSKTLSNAELYQWISVVAEGDLELLRSKIKEGPDLIDEGKDILLGYETLALKRETAKAGSSLNPINDPQRAMLCFALINGTPLRASSNHEPETDLIKSGDQKKTKKKEKEKNKTKTKKVSVAPPPEEMDREENHRNFEAMSFEEHHQLMTHRLDVIQEMQGHSDYQRLVFATQKFTGIPLDAHEQATASRDDWVEVIENVHQTKGIKYGMRVLQPKMSLMEFALNLCDPLFLGRYQLKTVDWPAEEEHGRHGSTAFKEQIQIPSRSATEHQKLRQSRWAVVQELLKTPISVNTINAKGDSVLIRALQMEDCPDDLIEALIQKSDCTIKNKDNKTALQYALKRGPENIIAQVLQKTGPLNERFEIDEMKGIIEAAINHSVSLNIIESMLDQAGPEITKSDAHQGLPLLSVAILRNNPALIELMREKGFKVLDLEQRGVESPLFYWALMARFNPNFKQEKDAISYLIQWEEEEKHIKRGSQSSPTKAAGQEAADEDEKEQTILERMGVGPEDRSFIQGCRLAVREKMMLAHQVTLGGIHDSEEASQNARKTARPVL